MLPGSAKRGRLRGIPCVGGGNNKRSSKDWRASSLKQRRVVGCHYFGRGSFVRSIYFFFALLSVGLLGLREIVVVLAQEEDYVHGGDVSMECEKNCSCNGSLDGGVNVHVFDYPTTGQRIALVDDSYSEILETTCETSAVAAGDTLYTLSDVELTERESGVVSMSSANCPDVDIDEPADCYRGETSSSLDGGVELDITICFCKHVDDNDIAYKSRVSFAYSGTNDVVMLDDELHICSDFDFISQMATFVVEGESHYYNFELDMPDEDTSSLSVDPAPPSSAGALLCGEEDTPSPVATTLPTEQPTPSAATTAPTTLSPLPALKTPGPTIAPVTTRPSSAPDTPLQTSAPVSSPEARTTTLAPSVGSTSGPTPTITVVPEPPSGDMPIGSTVFPTGAPIGAVAGTAAPTVTGTGIHHSSNTTTAPSSTGGNFSPAPSGGTTEPSSAGVVSDGQSLEFEDNPLRVAGGNGIALAALGVLSVLTFLPTCVK